MNTKFYVIAGIFLVLVSGLAYLFQLDDLAAAQGPSPGQYPTSTTEPAPARPVTPGNNEAAVGGLKF